LVCLNGFFKIQSVAVSEKDIIQIFFYLKDKFNSEFVSSLSRSVIVSYGNMNSLQKKASGIFFF